MAKEKAKKIKERRTTIRINPFFYTVEVYVSDDIRESARKVGIETNVNWEALHAGAENRLLSMIFLPEDAEPGTIAHECFHCVWHIMRQIGAEFENEVMAYTLTYLVTQVMDFAYRTKRTKASKITPRVNRRSGSMTFLSK